MNTDAFHKAYSHLATNLSRSPVVEVTFLDGSRESGFVVGMIHMCGFALERRNVRRDEDGRVEVDLAQVFELKVTMPGEPVETF